MTTSIERLNFSIVLLSVILSAALLVTTSSTPARTSSHDGSIAMSASLDDTAPAPGAACASVNCLQGTCKPANSLLGFDCECYQGWMKPLGLPFCVLPNCSINMACGNESLPLSPPPAAPVPLPPPFSACFLVWCGDGQCVPGNGTNHTCECNNGSANFLDNKGLPCLKKCNFGADCSNVQIGPPVPPPPRPPHSSAAPPGNGLTSALPPSCSRNCKVLSTVLVTAIILIWI